MGAGWVRGDAESRHAPVLQFTCEDEPSEFQVLRIGLSRRPMDEVVAEVRTTLDPRRPAEPEERGRVAGLLHQVANDPQLTMLLAGHARDTTGEAWAAAHTRMNEKSARADEILSRPGVTRADLLRPAFGLVWGPHPLWLDFGEPRPALSTRRTVSDVLGDLHRRGMAGIQASDRPGLAKPLVTPGASPERGQPPR